MGFATFLEMISEKLDLQINASGLKISESETVAVPDTGPIDFDQGKAVALTALYLSGYTWIHDPATDVYRVLKLRDARDQELPLITEASKLPDSDLNVTYFMSIQHVPPEYIARNLRSFMPAASRIVPSEATRSLFITDSAHNMSKLKKLVEQLDTPEAAHGVKAWMASHSEDLDDPCVTPGSETQGPKPVILIVLFSLIALVVGFLIRGYVIRRIEGGL
jgi:hypothetical protein